MRCKMAGVVKSCLLGTLSCWSRLTAKLPLGVRRWPAVSRWISLAVGCFGMAAGGTTVTFSFWQNAMRAILNQTETQSNLVATLGNVGSMIAFPAGMLYESFGCEADVLVGGLSASLAFLLLWLGTSQWKTFFTANPWIVVILYFFVGIGCIFTYMASLLPNVENFPYHQRGKVIGILDAALSVGPTLLSVLYNTAFTNGYVEAGQEGKQNLPGFFLTACLLYIAVSIALFLFSGRIDVPGVQNGNETMPILQSDTLTSYESLGLSETRSSSHSRHSQTLTQSNPEQASSSANKLEERPPNDFSEFPFHEMPITKSIFRWNFHFLLLQFVLSACTQSVFQFNISTYLRSYGMAEYNLLFTTLNTTLQAVTKFAAGFISDMLAHSGRWPRAVVLLVPYALQTLSLLLSVFYGDEFIVLLLTVVFVGCAFGVTWSITPTLVGELFGSKYLGSNWGWSMLFTGALGFPFSIMFSSIYEAAITDPGDLYCYGLQCFTWSFAMLTGTSFCSFIFALGLTQNMLRNAADRRQLYGGV